MDFVDMMTLDFYVIIYQPKLAAQTGWLVHYNFEQLNKNVLDISDEIWKKNTKNLVI